MKYDAIIFSKQIVFERINVNIAITFEIKIVFKSSLLSIVTKRYHESIILECSYYLLFYLKQMRYNANILSLKMNLTECNYFFFFLCGSKCFERIIRCEMFI